MRGINGLQSKLVWCHCGVDIGLVLNGIFGLSFQERV